jgi:NADPH:quinone reductase-like Zn-dependent oxidoreductase
VHMRIQFSHGGPEVLDWHQLPATRPAPHEVCGAEPGDRSLSTPYFAARSGTSAGLPSAWVLSGAGIIEAVGLHVSDFRSVTVWPMPLGH